MAHGQPEQGIESITPRLGLPTALGMLVIIAGAIWLCVKHPGTALQALLLGVPLMAIVTLGDPMNHPLITMITGLLIVWVVLADAPDDTQS